MNQRDVELDLATIRAEIRRRMRRDYPDRRLITSGDLPGERREKLEETLWREDKVNLSCFRANHHPALRQWSVMAGREEDPLCGKEEEDAEHLWVRCPAFMHQRIRHGRGFRMEEMIDDLVRGSGASQVHPEASGLDTNTNKQHHRRTYTNYNKANWQEFTQENEQTPKDHNTPHTATKILTNAILAADKHHIPKGKIHHTHTNCCQKT